MRLTAAPKSYVDHLQAIPEFRACNRKQLDGVARLVDEVAVEAGEKLAYEGRVGRELFIIVSGTAEVTRQGVHLADLGPGDYFGELAALDPAPRNATVTATSNLEVLIMGPREFGAICEIPGFRDALLKGMVKRIREADEEVSRLKGD